MANLSYCRFRNTLKDLLDCEDNLHNELGKNEHRARKQLVEACQRIVDGAGEEHEYLPPVVEGEEMMDDETFLGAATPVKHSLDWNDGASLYKLEPPLDGHRYVVASQAMFGIVETMVFAADKHGNVTDWGGMGVVKEYSHLRALESIGYELQEGGA